MLSDNESARNTPTGVGKTFAVRAADTCCKKHPHGRGEDNESKALDKLSLETPPRAWGRRPLILAICKSVRNTPTGVGKTQQPRWGLARHRKHPHGRGDDGVCTASLTVVEETPPRAWGRHFIKSITYSVFAEDSNVFSITNFKPDNSIRSLLVSPMP